MSSYGKSAAALAVSDPIKPGTPETLSRLRDDNGYRHFRNQDIHKLKFLGRARALGFTIKDCRTLLALYEDESRASADVKRVARNHLAQIDAKIADLKGMRETLSHLVDACAGDDHPDCPILKDLGSKA